jgi:hypothetical protein
MPQCQSERSSKSSKELLERAAAKVGVLLRRDDPLPVEYFPLAQCPGALACLNLRFLSSLHESVDIYACLHRWRQSSHAWTQESRAEHAASNTSCDRFKGHEEIRPEGAGLAAQNNHSLMKPVQPDDTLAKIVGGGQKTLGSERAQRESEFILGSP